MIGTNKYRLIALFAIQVHTVFLLKSMNLNKQPLEEKINTYDNKLWDSYNNTKVLIRDNLMDLADSYAYKNDPEQIKTVQAILIKNIAKARAEKKASDYFHNNAGKKLIAQDIENLYRTSIKLAKDQENILLNDKRFKKEVINNINSPDKLAQKFGVSTFNELENYLAHSYMRGFIYKKLKEQEEKEQEKYILHHVQPFYSAEEPTLGERFRTWVSTLFASKPSVTMQFTGPTKRLPVPTSYRDYRKYTMPRWKEDIKPWLQEKKERYMPELQRIHKQKVHEYIYGEQPYAGTPW
ncbi:MAG TPA: hypothetical protein VGW78_00130 [Candidatus Babeliales bacterium]|nr:hypothetical protein [Candidatus Babeliales bacterium]